MPFENVDPNYGFVEIRVGTLCNVIVKVFLVSERVKAFEDELEKSLQILRAGTGDKDIAVTMR